MITGKFRDLWVKHGQQRQRLQMYYKHPSIGFDEDAESEHLDELYNAMIAELDFIDRSYVEARAASLLRTVVDLDRRG